MTNIPLAFRRLSVPIAAMADAAAMGGATVAWAAIPAADGSITACYKKPGDALRVVESAEDCKSGDTSLTWFQRCQRP